jgi:2-polyprenyl-6-methoxyphenol hydroxylase-like FAD-dependent oxidoreductase
MASLSLARMEYDVAIIGAGPVGLAMALELSRLGLSTIVLDRRPPLTADAGARPQLLVARAGDLAHLLQLGLDLSDERLVSKLATRCERDLASGQFASRDLRTWETAPEQIGNLWDLTRMPPVALVPIARLQLALLERARAHGAEVHYGCEVTRLRRHARFTSLVTADGASLRATIAIVATGAARALIERTTVTTTAPQRLIAGVFAIGGDRGRWLRVEVPVPGFSEPVRCTLLQTPTESEAGTAVLVDAQLDDREDDARLHECFAGTARVLGMDGAPFLVAPQVFGTSVTAVSQRIVAGDGRAPVIIAGDAAQTGHVFSGQTCFVNVALALGLADQLKDAKKAVANRSFQAPSLLGALAHYGKASELGARILAQNSLRHQRKHPPGLWALAGVARA